MTTEQVIGLVAALAVMCLGLLGSVLPGLPSTPLVMLAAIAHKIYFGPQGAAWWVLLIMGGLMALSVAMDYLATVYGARRLGATWRGAVGAIFGALLGLFFSLPGLIVGPFLGALAFEMAGGRDFKASNRAGLGALLGLLAGALGKLACGLAMMGLFAIHVLARSLA